MAAEILSTFTVGNLEFQLLTDVSPSAQHPTVTIAANPNYRVIGGGGQVLWSDGQPGALLTEMYPWTLGAQQPPGSHPQFDRNGAAWIVASKDHIAPFNHQVRGYAMCVAIKGGQLIPDATIGEPNGAYLIVPSLSYGQPSSHPNATATLPAGYQLVGGGVRTYSSPTGGQLLVASCPFPDITDRDPNLNPNGWYVESKDQGIPDPQTIDVWAIGLSEEFLANILPDGQSDGVNVVIQGPINSLYKANHPSQSITTELYTIGGGAYDRYSGYGNMLTASYPIAKHTSDPSNPLNVLAPAQPLNNPIPAWQVGGKDHEGCFLNGSLMIPIAAPDPSIISAYSIAITSNKSCPLPEPVIRRLQGRRAKR